MQAIAAVHPFAVDVASGVEMAGDPRRKDLAAVAAFVLACRG
jgi:phosphoribosylanthranilate isomerase